MKLLEIGQLENMDWTLDRTLDWTWTGLGLDLDWTCDFIKQVNIE